MYEIIVVTAIIRIAIIIIVNIITGFLKNTNKQTNTTPKDQLLSYHTLHLLTGFIGEPSGHRYASAKSREFDSGPITRIMPGECTDDRILVSASSGRIEPHQIWA